MPPLAYLTSQLDQLVVQVYQSTTDCGYAAAYQALGIIEKAIKEKGSANLILATGNSQLTFLQALRTLPIQWNKVYIFQMDEYIGLSPNHPASFSSFLQQHLIYYNQPAHFFSIFGSIDHLPETCQGYTLILKEFPADLCVMGIGENGHIAFNDPPYADFNDPLWVKTVVLDERSRKQQVGEGHFARLEDVPRQAITLTIPALLSAKRILCIVPEKRKAEAVKRTLLGQIHPDCPASVLRSQIHCILYLDIDSAGEVIHELKSHS